MWRRIVLGGKVVSMWVRGLVWGLRVVSEGGEGGRVMGVGVKMTARNGSLLDRVASMIALVILGAVSSVGVFIQVKELERKFGRGSV